MLRIAVCAFAAAGLYAGAAEAADMPARGVTAAAPAGRILVCTDPYCGLRAYPDPYIWDGLRPADDDLRLELDVRTWHRLRTLPVIYVEPAHRGRD